jgi:hypothetical protein
MGGPPDYEKYGFKNTVVDRLVNRPVFNVNSNRGSGQEAKIKEFSRTLNVPVEQTRVKLGDNSAMTYVAGAVGGGVKAIIKAAGKKLAKKGAIKGASKATE